MQAKDFQFIKLPSLSRPYLLKIISSVFYHTSFDVSDYLFFLSLVSTQQLCKQTHLVAKCTETF